MIRVLDVTLAFWMFLEGVMALLRSGFSQTRTWDLVRFLVFFTVMLLLIERAVRA